MILREGWVENRDVRLHYLESSPDTASRLKPVVYIPAAVSGAETFKPEMEALAPRRCLSVSLRGRGRSDAPESGYSFDHHISDIVALFSQLNLKRVCLMGWSLGVPYAIGYASNHPERVSGLVLLDYPARYPKFPPEWVERWSNPTFGFKPYVARALQEESAEIPLWDRLDKVECPSLVIGGGEPGALLRKEHAKMYREHLRDADIIIFDNSGHNVSEPDYDRFIGRVKRFLQRIDES